MSLNSGSIKETKPFYWFDFILLGNFVFLTHNTTSLKITYISWHSFEFYIVYYYILCSIFVLYFFNNHNLFRYIWLSVNNFQQHRYFLAKTQKFKHYNSSLHVRISVDNFVWVSKFVKGVFVRQFRYIFWKNSSIDSRKQNTHSYLLSFLVCIKYALVTI